MSLISVVIPLYNKGPHIARTLNSVLTQTFQNFEVIVVDGGSTDNGVDTVRKFFDPRVRLIYQDGKGVSEARNQGVDVSRGDLIAFLDADDEWTPSHIETLLRLREKYPEAGMYTTAYKAYKDNESFIKAGYKYIPKPPWEGLLPNYFISAALGESPVGTSVVGIPKSIFIEVGGFPRGYWWGEDHDLFGKIALKYPVAFSWEGEAIYYCNSINRLSEKKKPLDYEEPFVKTARSALIKGEVLPESIQPLNEYISKKEITRAAENVQIGNIATARVILKQCDTKWNKLLKLRILFLSKIPHPTFLILQKFKRFIDGQKMFP